MDPGISFLYTEIIQNPWRPMIFTHGVRRREEGILRGDKGPKYAP